MNESAQNFESITKPEKGANVTISIDLIRHPEKDHSTGKLTEEGKEAFYQKLKDELGEGQNYDMVKFYVSPLPRGQEAKESIQRFKDETKNDTSIRNRDQLVGRFQEVSGTDFKKGMTELLEQEEQMTREEIEAMRERDATIPAYEPANKDFETKSNEMLIRDFFDKKFPGAEFTGREHGEAIKDLIDHFAELAERLKSDSKVKLVLVSHSGVIEYLTKLIYLQNNPDVDPTTIDIAKIGGLVDFSEGPEINITSDEVGQQKIDFIFKDLRLEYRK